MNKKWLALWRHAVQTPNSHFQRRNTQGKAHRLLFQKVTDCMMFAGKVGRIIRILNDEPDDNLYFVIVSKSCENTKTASIVLLTLESVSSAHFCTSQNVSNRTLVTLGRASSELLASCSTSSISAVAGPAVTAMAPSCGAGGSRSWSARAQPFLHRASSRDDFCFSMSLKHRR